MSTLFEFVGMFFYIFSSTHSDIFYLTFLVSVRTKGELFNTYSLQCGNL